MYGSSPATHVKSIILPRQPKDKREFFESQTLYGRTMPGKLILVGLSTQSRDPPAVQNCSDLNLISLVLKAQEEIQ